jgi:glyoxalase family protein
MRLVKKTVNFDNHDVYHFYYGTERGAPGTLWTTFPFKDRGVRAGIKGAGQVVTTSFSVPSSSIGFWRARLKAHGADAREVETRFGEEALVTTDPSGLRFELIGTAGDARAPWAGNGVGAGEAIRGLHGVTMAVRSLEPTRALMTELLGYTVVNQHGSRTRLAAGGNAAGHFIDIVEDPDGVGAVNGVGTVHHVAMAISTADEQLRLREELLGMGLKVTEVRDRCYFQSIYFREPGGVLFEVATIRPGFTVDEELSALGRALKLPYWEEPHRSTIEAGLAPVVYR